MRKFLLIFLFPIISVMGFTDTWRVFHSNISDFPNGKILQENDKINIQEDQFLFIENTVKKQRAIILIPGEKTVLQGIEEAKRIDQHKKDKISSDNVYLNLLFKISEWDLPFWSEE